MNLKQLLEYITRNYPRRDMVNFKTIKFGGNEPTQRLLNNGLKGLSDEKELLVDGFTSNGSAGSGKWATVPWIALFDTNISTSAKKGFYVVYLFRPDLKYIYLSLNQGWSSYKDKYGQKDGLKNLVKVAKYWQGNLFSMTDNMSIRDIDLQSTQYQGTSLPIGYEKANILSIKYKSDAIPENKQLVEDLVSMRVVLTELEKKLFSPDNLDYSISYILRAASLGEGESNYNIQKRIQEITTNIANVQQVVAPKVGLPKSSAAVKVGRTNYEVRERNNSKVGYLGEILVYKLEKKRLEQANKLELSEKVEQVSQKQGDGLGYDILSYTDAGEPIYIEVKTTKGDIDTPFYLSQNELNASVKYGDRYRLYRIYNIMDNYKFYVVSGDLTDKLDLSAQSYRAMPRNEE